MIRILASLGLDFANSFNILPYIKSYMNKYCLFVVFSQPKCVVDKMIQYDSAPSVERSMGTIAETHTCIAYYFQALLDILQLSAGRLEG